MAKKPARKPTPLPSPRTAQSPDQAALMARLSPAFNPLAAMAQAAPMVVRPPQRGKKGRRGR
jgi:hypothetical protein